MRPKIASKFGFKEIDELRHLFIEKGWDRFVEFNGFFENYCVMLENLNEAQTKVMIDLTRDFFWLRSVEYLSQLKRTLQMLAGYDHLNLEKVHIIPLISKTDREKQKVKSSTTVAYLCQNNELRYMDMFKNTSFVIHNNLTVIPKQSTLKGNRNPIILIDDFIGTGDTAKEALSEILGYREYDNETLYVASLICQDEGRQAIEDFGFNVLSPMIMQKGITDNYAEPQASEIRNMMTSIEAILELDENFDTEYRFGYKKSEALVSLIRTPNNTFPIYWFSAKNGLGKKWMAPFPRNN